MALSMYLSLSGTASKNATIRALARKFLSVDGLERYDSLMKEVGKVARRRNNVVHALWGIAPEFPDHIIWQSLEDAAAYGFSNSIALNCQKYDEGDFLTLVADIEKLSLKLLMFRPLDYFQCDVNVQAAIPMGSKNSAEYSIKFPISDA